MSEEDPKLPPGWEWDPETTAAYDASGATSVYSESSGSYIPNAEPPMLDTAYPTEETRQKAVKEVVDESWRIYREHWKDAMEQERERIVAHLFLRGRLLIDQGDLEAGRELVGESARIRGGGELFTKDNDPDMVTVEKSEYHVVVVPRRRLLTNAEDEELVDTLADAFDAGVKRREEEEKVAVEHAVAKERNRYESGQD